MKKLLFLLMALIATTALWASNVITYTAASKLSETTTSVSSGLHTNAFNMAISSHTFSNGIGTITFTGEVTTIGDYAFYGCGGLTSVTIPNSVTMIGSDAFGACSGLTSVTIPNSVTTIGEWAFFSCDGLTSVTIPNSVTMIGRYAFGACSGLTKTNYTGTIADWCKIKFDRDYANPIYNSHNFYINDVEVKDLVIPEGVDMIGNYAFYGCDGLTSVTIPNSVTTIGDDAFCYCSGLTSVIIPNSVTMIGRYAFYGCSGLTSVTIGNSVTTIGEYAFCCSGLKKTNYTGTIADWCKIKFDNDYANPMYYSHNYYINDMEVKDLVISNGVDTIGERAFYNCRGLTSVTIPNSVTTIGDKAFSGCSGLTSVTLNSNAIVSKNYTSSNNIKNIFGTQVTEYIIGNSVTTIGSDVFSDCSGLTSVTIPNSVTTIGGYAFSGCSGLTSVTIPNSVTTIGKYAFNGCSGLTSISCYATIPPTCGYSCFYNIPKSILVYVPARSVDVYKKTSEWKNFTNIQGFPEDYAMITCLVSNGTITGGGKMIKGDTCTLAVTPDYGYHFTKWNDGNTDNPRSFVITQDSTFTAQIDIAQSGQCGDNLYWRLVSESLIITGNGKMYDYTESHLAEWYLSNRKIAQLVLPDGFTHIGNYAFANCIGLTSITIPNSVTTIGNSAFEGCSSIKSVTWNAKNCSGYNFGSQVETFVFSDSVEVIPANVCQDMVQLTTITIPSSVQSVGNSAFKNCTGISELNINDGLTTIGDYAFYGLSNKNLKEIALPNSVETIGKYAFAECSYLKTITLGAKLEDIDEYAFQNDERLIYVNCYAEEPPVLQENAFDNYDIYLQVPCDVLDEYKVAKGWKLFNKENVSCLSAEGKTITSGQVIVTPSVTTAEFVWPANDQADSYSLKITKDGVVFCTLTFNAQGQLRAIAFAPSRSGEQPTRAAQATANGWQFTVTGLNQASKYAYTLDVTNAQKQSIKTYTGEFVTDGYTDLFSVPYNEREGLGAVKFIHNGQLFILRNGVLFNARGARVK